MKVFETYEQLTDYLFRIVDNGGQSADRYTVIFTDASYLTLSDNPGHPMGVSLSDYGPEIVTYAQTAVDDGEAVDLSFYDLPEGLQRHILARCNQGFADFAEAVEKREPHAAARFRDEAKTHEGTHACAGKGIYQVGEGFAIRTDNGDFSGASEDRGPFATAAEAVRASLPDEHGLAGPEYHSTCGVAAPRDEARIEAVKALEARREAEFEAMD